MILRVCTALFIIPIFCCMADENILDNAAFEKSGSFWSVKKDNAKCSITAGKIKLILDEKKVFSPESMSSSDLNNENMIKYISFLSREKGQQTFYDFLNTRKENLKSLNISEKNGILKIEVSQEQPKFKVLKTFEFYNDKPFFRIKYDITFIENCVYDGVWVGVSTTPETSFMLSGDKNHVSTIKNELSEKGKWYGFKRFPENRWFGFYYGNLTGGFAVMCPDLKSWMEINKSFICNKPQGGFSLELGKVMGKELRKDESVHYDFFIMPLKCKLSDFENTVSQSFKNFFPEN